MTLFGLKNLKISDSTNFTSPLKMKLRKIINKPLRIILKTFDGKKVLIEGREKLRKDEQYIFSSSHYFTEDIQIAIGSLDRNAWALIGTTNQLEHNPKIYAAWLNGMIYVNRLDDKSRKESVLKMEYILKHGGNVLIFPEGGWNNTENLLINPLFAGPYKVSVTTMKKVVPLVVYNGEDNRVYVKFGEPLALYKYEKKDALLLLRNSMSTLMYELMEKYSKPLARGTIEGDFHLQFMEDRKNEYLKNKWTEDVWNEELTVYKSKEVVTPQEVRASFDKVEITKDNAYIFAPTLVKRLEDQRYDFNEYMHKNWHK